MFLVILDKVKRIGIWLTTFLRHQKLFRFYAGSIITWTPTLFMDKEVVVWALFVSKISPGTYGRGLGPLGFFYFFIMTLKSEFWDTSPNSDLFLRILRIKSEVKQKFTCADFWLQSQNSDFKGPILYCISSISHSCQKSNNSVFDMHCPKHIFGPEF